MSQSAAGLQVGMIRIMIMTLMTIITNILNMMVMVDNHLINPDGRGKPWQPCEGRDEDSNPCKEESKSEGKASNIILKNDKKKH